MESRKLGLVPVLILVLCPFVAGNQSDWQQVVGGPAATAGGFGETENIRIPNLVTLNGEFFASTFNSQTGPEIWKSANAIEWIRMHSGGIGSTFPSLLGMISFNNVLLAAPGSADVCLWDSSTGGNWTPVNGPCADPLLGNEEVLSFKVFGQHLYASTRNHLHGGEIWRSLDGKTWEPVMTGGFGGQQTNPEIAYLEVFQGQLYATTVTGCEMWRSDDGELWTQVVDDCFGSYSDVRALEPFNGVLFTGLGFDGLPGFNLWNSTDGLNWLEGSFEPNYLLTGTDKRLYSVNMLFEIVVSPDGTDWAPDNSPKFGNPNNWYYSGFFVVDGFVYVGVQNSAEGAQLWRKFTGLFADGFETGDTTLWSATIP